MARCVLPYLASIPTDTDTEVSAKGIQIVIDAAARAWQNHFNALIAILAEVVRNALDKDIRLMALSGLFALVTASIPHAAASPDHQQELLVLLTGLLGCPDVAVRKEVLLFLLGQASAAIN